MTIEKYFEEYENAYHEKQKALKTYIDAKANFYTLTGIEYDTMPKAKGKTLGLDDLMASIETLMETYQEKCEIYINELNKCRRDIDKIENTVYKVIIEYAYLYFESNKSITESLQKYHKLDYTLGYVKRLRAAANHEFERIINKSN